MKRTAACLWLEMAERDLKASKILLENSLLEVALFHAQQAVEKALKALIAYYGFEAPRSHNIDRLLSFLEGIGVDTDLIRRLQPERLTKFSIIGRYPAFQPISQEEGELVYTAEMVLNQVKGLVGGC